MQVNINTEIRDFFEEFKIYAQLKYMTTKV